MSLHRAEEETSEALCAAVLALLPRGSITHSLKSDDIQCSLGNLIVLSQMLRVFEKPDSDSKEQNDENGLLHCETIARITGHLKTRFFFFWLFTTVTESFCLLIASSVHSCDSKVITCKRKIQSKKKIKVKATLKCWVNDTQHRKGFCMFILCVIPDDPLAIFSTVSLPLAVNSNPYQQREKVCFKNSSRESA